MMLILSLIGFFMIIFIVGAILTMIVMLPFKTASSMKKQKAKREAKRRARS